jgi:hypothetical protein
MVLHLGVQGKMVSPGVGYGGPSKDQCRESRRLTSLLSQLGPVPEIGPGANVAEVDQRLLRQ